jgi:LAGLIDADG-like domain
MPINLNHCDKACIGCIKTYAKKHERSPQFMVTCKGIPKTYLSLSVMDNLPESDRHTALSMVDPVTWASENLDWHCIDSDGEIWKRKNPNEYEDWVSANPGSKMKSRYHRPYQAEMLRCSSKQKVYRCGRQIGKCLEENTLIMTPSGPVPIQSLKPGDKVIGWNKDDTISETTVLALHDQGIQDVVDLTHSRVQQVASTLEHRWLTTGRNHINEVRHLKDFTRDTYIVRKWYKAPLGSINEPHAYAIGALLGDGCSREKGQIIYLSSQDEIIPSMVAKTLNGTYVKTSSDNYTWAIKDNDTCNHYNEWLKNRYAHEKIIDLDILKTWNRESCLKLLAGLLDTDGSVQVFNDILQITIGMQAKSVIDAIQYLFMALFQYKANLVIDNRNKYKNGPVYIIKCANNLFSKIILKELDPYLTLDRKKWKEVYNLLSENNSNTNSIGCKHNGITRKAQCWDITVNNSTNLYLLANGMVTHNTESIVVSMLYHLFTKPNIPESEGFKIVVITPYQSQIDLIFSRAMELIRSNPVLSNSIKRHVKAPQYTIELHNGSIIRGFTAGTKSGNNAGAVRGQHAHMLVFDEADYLASGDMDSALSIITNYPDASVWMSSTPTGKREKFYETCQSKLWKEFFYPSQINPMWNQKTEDMFKEQLTGLGYIHEVEAEFGEQEEGVFQNVYIQAAKAEYSYGSLPKSQEWIYTIGVDWNDIKIGTTIAIVGFNPTEQQFVLVDRHIIKKEGWTQLAACQKIAELNRFWEPAFIYIDKGYGGTQDEILRKYGYDAMFDPKRGHKHPDARLKSIVKAYDFGSKVEIHDLITKQPILKSAKPFLVENMVRRFEQKMFRFSADDSQLEKELQGYIIDRINQSGTPVFKASDPNTGDHNLDAVMLAVVAYQLEKTPFGTPIYRAEIAISGKIGERKEAHPDEILPGTINIVDQGGKPKNDPRINSRPDFKRTETTTQESSILLNDLPAAHVGSQIRNWRNDDWLKDESISKPNRLTPMSKPKKPARRNI